MTTSTSRPASAASHASRCPGRKAGKPKCRRRGATRSTAATLPAAAAAAPPPWRTFHARREAVTSAGAGGNDRELLEGELPIRVLGALERVVAGEAGVAVGLTGGADGLVDAVQREVGQRVAVELLGD